MNQRLLVELGRSQRLAIVNQLKRSQGMSVKELAAALKMSYMGVKGHCLDLHKRGYLDTWRRPQALGRPELVYRLTQRAHELFPQASNAATLELLEAAATLYGPSGPEKLLFQFFQLKGERYASRVKPQTLPERAACFSQIRDQEGYMATMEQREATIQLVEYHSPILDLLRAYPIVARLETDMVSRVLGVPVSREESTASGLYCCRFSVCGNQSGAE